MLLLQKYIIQNRICLLFRFLRVVAYWQFTRMVHGWSKDGRVPLPFCAYNIILTKHKPKDNAFTGFDELETDVESQ